MSAIEEHFEEEEQEEDLLDYEEEAAEDATYGAEIHDGVGEAEEGDDDQYGGDEEVYQEEEEQLEQDEQGGDDGDGDLLGGLEDADEEQEANVQQPPGGEEPGLRSAQQPAGGKKIIDLTKSSNRLERIQQQRLGGQAKGQQPQQQQQQPQPQRQQQGSTKPGPQQQQQQSAQHLRKRMGPCRYFMLKCVNTVNWETAQKYSCWATQPQNERVFNAALQKGCTVVLFLSCNGSGAVQGYGIMQTPSGQGPAGVPWQDITDKVNNFGVSWDCTAAVRFEQVKDIYNPWGGDRMRREAIPLNRHRDGQELAPPAGELLLAAMNRNAAAVGKPAKGPLAFMGMQPGVMGMQQQQRPGMHGMPPHLQQRMMMQQQGGVAGRAGPAGPVQGRGLVGGRTGMAGAAVGIGGGRGGMPAGGARQPPPPPPGRPGIRAGPQQQAPPGLARFVGRLEGLNGPSAPHAGPGQQHWQQQQRSAAPPPQRTAGHMQQRGVSPPAARGHSRGGYTEERRRSHSRSPSRKSSRSRSRSPVHGARSHLEHRGQGGSRGVGEVTHHNSKQDRGRSDKADRNEGLEETSSENITYEMYLAAYDKVQQRLKTVSNILQKDSQQQQQVSRPQQQQVAVAAPTSRMQQQQQQRQKQLLQQQQQGAAGGRMGPAAGGNAPMQQLVVYDGDGVDGSSVNGAGGGMQLQQQGRAGAGRVARGGMPAAAGVGGNPAVGRALAAANIPTLEEYMARIKGKWAARGMPCPHSDEAIRAKYFEKLPQYTGGAAGGPAAAPAGGNAAAAQQRLAGTKRPLQQAGGGPVAAAAGPGNMRRAPGAAAAGSMAAGSRQQAAATGKMNPGGMNPAGMPVGMQNPSASMGMNAGMMGMGGMNPMMMNAMMNNPMAAMMGGMGMMGPGVMGMGMNPAMMMQGGMGSMPPGGRGGGRGRNRQQQQGGF